MTTMYKCIKQDGTTFTTEDSLAASAVDVAGGQVITLSKEEYEKQTERTGEQKNPRNVKKLPQSVQKNKKFN